MRSYGGTRGGAVARNGLAGIGVAAFAVACCGALPLAVGALGGLALGAWLGFGAGLVALAGATLALVVSRRRRRCATDPARVPQAAGASDRDG